MIIDPVLAGLFVFIVAMSFRALTLFIAYAYPRLTTDRIVKITDANNDTAYIVETYLFFPLIDVRTSAPSTLENAQKKIKWNNEQKIISREVIA